jgi:hypothetical protein
MSKAPYCPIHKKSLDAHTHLEDIADEAAFQEFVHKMTARTSIGEDGDVETLCIHDIGHSRHPHTCDSCCGRT